MNIISIIFKVNSKTMKRFFLMLANMLAIATFAVGFVACGDEEETPSVEATVVTIEPPALNLKVGEEQTLTATVYPEAAVNKTVTWSSDAPAIAEVNASTGKITAKAAGTAKITAKTANGKTAVCALTVAINVIEVTSVSVTPATLDVKVGETRTLEVAVEPQNATNKTVTWRSDASAIVSVNASTGAVVVTARLLGTAHIIATTANNKSDTCTVTVSPTEVETVTVTPAAVTLKEDEKTTLTATVLPADATNSAITWSSNAPNIAEVNVLTGEVTAKVPGTATITATAGGVTGTCAVTVLEKDVTFLNITLDSTSVYLEDKLKLIAGVIPSTATLTWSSNAPEIASVDQTGEVTGVSLGRATITVTAANGISDSCIVKVTEYLGNMFKGPHILSADAPYELPACDFDLGGEGVGYHDVNGGGNTSYRADNGDPDGTGVELEGSGNNVAYTAEGEWLMYTVKVQDAGLYAIDVYLSATGTSNIGIAISEESDGETWDERGPWSVPSNGSWTNWLYAFETYPQLGGAPTFRLKADKLYKVKFLLNSGGFNLMGLKFTHTGE
jgi:uncharacterized protein YjdB